MKRIEMMRVENYIYSIKYVNNSLVELVHANSYYLKSRGFECFIIMRVKFNIKNSVNNNLLRLEAIS